MPWKYILNEKEEIQGIELDNNGNPIYVHPDKSESGLNGDMVLNRQSELMSSVNKYKEDIALYQNKINAIGTDLIDNPEVIREALEVKADVDAGKLVAEGRQNEAIQRALAEKEAAHSSELKDIVDQLNKTHSALHKQTILNCLESSKYLKEKANGMPADVAFALFGHHFQMTKDQNGNYLDKPICKTKNGDTMLSLMTGEPASPEEAIQKLFEQNPHADYFATRLSGGPNPGGIGNKQSDVSIGKTSHREFMAAYKKAEETNSRLLQDGKVIADFSN